MNRFHATIFNQLLQIIPNHRFESDFGQQEDKRSKKFSVKQLFTILFSAQVMWASSLREINTTLMTKQEHLYHLGINSVARSTIADKNAATNHDFFKKLFLLVLQECKKYSYNTREFSFSNELYSLDWSIIDLCLSLYDWAKYRKTKWAIRLHVLLNNKQFIPELIRVTDGKYHEIRIANQLKRKEFSPWSIFCFDKWYFDISLFAAINKNNHFFVTRIKNNTLYVVNESHPANEQWVVKDETVDLIGIEAIKQYEPSLRLVTYYDKEHDVMYKFLTNNFDFSAKTIADIYKSRRLVEIFFKWIKQNLKIKSFLWTSKNAVMNQIWIALIYFLIISFLAFKTKMKSSLLELSRVIPATLWDKISIANIFWMTYEKFVCIHPPNQKTLF